jgi:hypothetical protein
MKKNLVFAAAIAITGLVYSSNLSTFGQNRKSMNLDDKYTLSMAFHRTDTILVVVPDGKEITETDKTDIENYAYLEKGQNKPAYIFKPESEVTSKDIKKHILFHGSFNDFKRKEFLKIPIKKHGKGFEFNNRVFDQETDAFFYINKNATRMYVCTNSNQNRQVYNTIGGSAYPLHIFRGNDIVVTGVYL